MNIAIIGSKGRMGQAIAAAAKTIPDLTVTAQLDFGDNIEAGISTADVIIDFTSPALTPELAQFAIKHKKPIVIGTTGHTPEQRAQLLALLTKTVPVVWTGNYSIGVNLLYALTQRAAAALPADYTAEIIELHHRHKKDAPSGTADNLLDIILAERSLTRKNTIHGRHGIIGERPQDQVAIHSIRGGDIVGEHTVLFTTDGERIELTHKATDRAIFAKGALHAAQWLVTQKPAPAHYNMQQVLNLQ